MAYSPTPPAPRGSSLGDPGTTGTAVSGSAPAATGQQAMPAQPAGVGWDMSGGGGGWGGAAAAAPTPASGQGDQGQFQPWPDEDVHDPLSDPRWQGQRGWEAQGIKAPPPTTFSQTQQQPGFQPQAPAPQPSPQQQMLGQAPPQQFPGDGLPRLNKRYSDVGGSSGL